MRGLTFRHLGDTISRVPLINLANSPLKAIVDECDLELVSKHKWHIQPKSCGVMYAISARKRKTLRMHRLIMGAKPGEQIDHINHNGLDNRRCNLRVAGRNGNSRNMRKATGQTSRFKGVHRRGKYWRAGIRIDGRLINIGTFTDETLAGAAYNHFARVYFREFACLNPLDVVLEQEALALMANPKKLHRPIGKCGSQFVGVRKESAHRWGARIRHKGKLLRLGVFDTEMDAANAYNIAARKYHGARAKQNILPT